jgi:hypothetical protein
MTKFVLPAAIAAIALAAPFAVQAQTMQPMAQPSPYHATNASVITPEPAQPTMSETTTNISATVSEPAAGEYAYPGSPGYGYDAPAPAFAEPAMQPVTPRTTWIPGHYNWNPATSNYVWTQGQYIEAPTTTAQWIPGHWEQTPTAWIWINGGWR